MPLSVFLSIGTPANPRQEAFRDAVQSLLKQHGFVPRTPGQNEFTNTQPLYAVERTMKECHGTVVVAYERIAIDAGVERAGGPHESVLKGVKLATPWNHLEGAMSYTLRLPLLVIAENGMRGGALLDDRYDWQVQSVELTPAALLTPAFLGAFQDWKQKVIEHSTAVEAAALTLASAAPAITERTTVGELIKGMPPRQLWGVISTLAAAFIATAGVGYRVGNALKEPATTEVRQAGGSPRSEEAWATDSSIALFFGNKVSIGARRISDVADSATLVIQAAGTGADSVRLRQGDAHSFTMSGSDYRVYLLDVRGGNGRPGSVKVLVSAMDK